MLETTSLIFYRPECYEAEIHPAYEKWWKMYAVQRVACEIQSKYIPWKTVELHGESNAGYRNSAVAFGTAICSSLIAREIISFCPLFQRTNIPHWRLMWENIATSTLVYIFKRYLVCVHCSSFLFYFCGRWQFRIFMRLRFYFCRRWPFIIFMRLPLVFIFSYLDLNVLMSWDSILTVCMMFWSVSLFFDRYRADICRTRPRGSYSRSWCYSKTYWVLTLLQL